MPRGQRNNVNAADGAEKKTRNVRPRLSDSDKAVQEVEKLLPRVKSTEEKLKKVRATAAELDETLKHEKKLLQWALANPFLPEGYAEQADVPEGDALTVVQDEGDDTTAIVDATSDEGESPNEDDIPGAEVVAEAAEDRIEQQTDEVDDDDPFAGR